MFRSSFLAAAAALFTAHVSAQTHSLCDPTWGNVTCPDNAALGTTIDYVFNDTQAEMDKRYFNVSAGASLIDFAKDGASFTMQKHGDSVRVTTNFYIFYGRVEAIMQAAPGRGVISSINLLSDDLDEIDWEVKGQNNTHVFNNWYGKGNQSQSNGGEPELADSMDGFHNYTIIWTEQELQFWLDGNQVRTVASDEPGRYPQTPCYINLSLWAGGDPNNGEGVITWAGGETDYKAG
jgi:beta-glucanase (GH16 family)